MPLRPGVAYTGAVTLPPRLQFLAAAFATLSGCATLLTAERAVLPVTSIPPGAEVTLDGVPRGRTPVDVTVPNTSTPASLVVKAADGNTAAFAVSRSVDPTVAANLLLSYLAPVGLLVDLVQGHLYRIDERAYLARFGSAATDGAWLPGRVLGQADGGVLVDATAMGSVAAGDHVEFFGTRAPLETRIVGVVRSVGPEGATVELGRGEDPGEAAIAQPTTQPVTAALFFPGMRLGGNADIEGATLAPNGEIGASWGRIDIGWQPTSILRLWGGTTPIGTVWSRAVTAAGSVTTETRHWGVYTGVSLSGTYVEFGMGGALLYGRDVRRAAAGLNSGSDHVVFLFRMGSPQGLCSWVRGIEDQDVMWRTQVPIARSVDFLFTVRNTTLDTTDGFDSFGRSSDTEIFSFAIGARGVLSVLTERSLLRGALELAFHSARSFSNSNCSGTEIDSGFGCFRSTQAQGLMLLASISPEF